MTCHFQPTVAKPLKADGPPVGAIGVGELGKSRWGRVVRCTQCYPSSSRHYQVLLLFNDGTQLSHVCRDAEDFSSVQYAQKRRVRNARTMFHEAVPSAPRRMCDPHHLVIHQHPTLQLQCPRYLHSSNPAWPTRSTRTVQSRQNRDSMDCPWKFCCVSCSTWTNETPRASPGCASHWLTRGSPSSGVRCL